MNLAAISAGIEETLLPDIDCAAIRPVHLFVGILLLQLCKQRGEIPVFALGGLKLSGGTAGRVLVEPLIPISLCWRHIAARGDVPAHPAAERIALVAAAAYLFGLDAGGVIYLERPEHSVQHVTAQIGRAH